MKQVICYILTIFACLPLMAQQTGKLDITTLNWNELKIDSVLPVYTEVVPLQSDYSMYQYPAERACWILPSFPSSAVAIPI